MDDAAEQRFLICGELSEDEFVAAQRLHAGRFAGCVMPGVVALFALAMTALCLFIGSWEVWSLLAFVWGVVALYIYARGSLRRLYRNERHLLPPYEGALSYAHLHVWGRVRHGCRAVVDVPAHEAVLRDGSNA
jgi:hypothetical protein